MANFIERLYLKEKLQPSLMALFSSRVFQAVGMAFFNLFIPIFLFQKFNQDIRVVLVYFILSFSSLILFVPITARLISRIGLREMMIIGSLFLIGSLVAFRFFQPTYLYLGLPLLLQLFYRSFYWVPYHTEFAEFTEKLHRGKEIGFLEAVYAILGIGVPLTAGYIISTYGFDNLFLVVIIIETLAIFPLFLTRKIKEEFTWSYGKTFKKLFKRGNRGYCLSFFADGFQDIIGTVIWPVFIFLILDEKYAQVGLVTSLIILTTVVLRLITGSLIDRYPKKKMIRYSSFFYSLGWFFKGLVNSTSQIFMAGAYHDFTHVVLRSSFDTLRYEKAADKGHYVDEYTVLREISLCLGRVVMLVVILLILNYTDLRVAFFLAALSSLFISVI